MSRAIDVVALEGVHEREGVAHGVQEVHPVAGPERVKPGDRGAHRDGAGAHDKSVVAQRVECVLGAGGEDAVREMVDAADRGVEAQGHAGGLEVGEGPVREVAPVRYLARDVVGDTADREVGVGVGDHDGHLRARVKLAGAQRSADAGIATADRHQPHQSAPRRVGSRGFDGMVCGSSLVRAAAGFVGVGDDDRRGLGGG